jgi:hypothetical protein
MDPLLILQYLIQAKLLQSCLWIFHIALKNKTPFSNMSLGFKRIASILKTVVDLKLLQSVEKRLNKP